MNVTILGGGAWGSAIAIHLAKNHSDSRIEFWVRDAQQAQQMQLDRVNQRYLPGVHFPKNLVVSSQWDDIWLGQDLAKQLIVIATPLAGLEQTSPCSCSRSIASTAHKKSRIAYRNASGGAGVMARWPPPKI